MNFRFEKIEETDDGFELKVQTWIDDSRNKWDANFLIPMSVFTKFNVRRLEVSEWVTDNTETIQMVCKETLINRSEFHSGDIQMSVVDFKDSMGL